MNYCEECGDEFDTYEGKDGFCFDCMEDFWEFDK